MGTPDFAVPVLEALIDAGHEISAVYCQPPRPAGRGQKPRKSPVQRVAETHGIEVRTPKSLKKAEAQQDFKALGADLAIVVAYGLILPKAILEAPEFGCLNVHASLLPRWRGAAPIHRAVLAGDAETGVAIMRMDEGLDTGPVLLEARTAIGADDTTGALHDRLAALGAATLLAAIDGYVAGRLTPRPQPKEGVRYAAKIDKAEARIDWSKSAAEIDRQVRGLHPFPGAFTSIGGVRLRLHQGEDIALSPGVPPGTVIDDRLGIACGEGVYRPGLIQREGRAAMKAGELLKGFPINKGERFD